MGGWPVPVAGQRSTHGDPARWASAAVSGAEQAQGTGLRQHGWPGTGSGGGGRLGAGSGHADEWFRLLPTPCYRAMNEPAASLKALAIISLEGVPDAP